MFSISVYTAVHVITSFWPHSGYVAFYFYLFASPGQDGMSRNRCRKKRRKTKTTKESITVLELPYTEMVKSGTRIDSGSEKI